MMSLKDLPVPLSIWGFTSNQIDEIFPTPAEREAFDAWFYGQTGAIDPDYGLVVYDYDVRRYIASLVTGRPTIWD